MRSLAASQNPRSEKKQAWPRKRRHWNVQLGGHGEVPALGPWRVSPI